MKDIFSAIADMSITGSYIILAVLIIRAAMKRLPKRFSYMLWAIPALRLLCPFTIPSAVSLFNIVKPRAAEKRIIQAAEVVSRAVPVTYNAAPEYIPTETAAAYNSLTSRPAPAVNTSFKPDIGEIVAWVWLTVAVGIVIYCAVCYLRMYITLKGSRRDGDYYISSKIESPLVFGFICPKIYLTEGLSETDIRCILAHERTHIRRGDHIAKLICIAIAALHWFNPLVWIGINRMNKDMELSCDEAALGILGSESKKAYAKALLNMALKQNRISLCGVLCFGEKNIKTRIKGVLSMKKPKIIAIVAAVAVVVVSAVCLLTSALPEKPMPMEGTNINQLLNSGTGYIPDIKSDKALSYAGAEDRICLSIKTCGDYRFGLVAQKAFVDSERNDNKIYVSRLELMFTNGTNRVGSMILPGENYVLDSNKLDSYLIVKDLKRPLVIFNSNIDNTSHIFSFDEKERFIVMGEPLTADKSPLASQSLRSDASLSSYSDYLYSPDNNIRIAFDFWEHTYDIQYDCFEPSDVITRYLEAQVIGDVMECEISEIAEAFEYGGLAFYGIGKGNMLEGHGGVYKASYSLKYRDNAEEPREEFFIVRFVEGNARIEKIIPCDLKVMAGTIEKRLTSEEDEQIYFLDKDSGEEYVLHNRIGPLITYSTGTEIVQGYSLEKIPEGTDIELCYNGDEVTEDSIAYLKILYWNPLAQ